MRGRVELHSKLGVGTRFIVDLPLPWIPEALHTRTRGERAALAATRPLRILLVEDDPTVAEVVSGLLSARGHHITHSAHALAALTEAAGAPFDVALLDLDLPGLDGLALARQLRMFGYEMLLIAVTARADADAEPQVRAAGFDGFLRKPVTGDMLAEAIEAVMEPGLGTPDSKKRRVAAAVLPRVPSPRSRVPATQSLPPPAWDAAGCRAAVRRSGSRSG